MIVNIYKLLLCVTSEYLYIVIVCRRCSVAQACPTLTAWTASHQASLSFTISWSLPKFTFIASVMPSSHFILWHPLLLSSIFPSIRDFHNESAVCIRWPKYWSFSLSISPSNGKYYPSSIAIKNWLLLETLLNYWWEHKLVQPVGENSMESLKN